MKLITTPVLAADTQSEDDIILEQKSNGKQLQRRFKIAKKLSDDRLCQRYYAINEIANKPCELHLWLHENSLNPKFWNNFVDVQRLSNSLDLENVQSFYGSGLSEKGQRFSVHSVAQGTYLEEESLHALPEPRKLSLLTTLADSLAKMHGEGFFHGQLTPTRIVAQFRGEEDQLPLCIIHSQAGIVLPVPLNESKNTIVNLTDLSYFAPELWDGQSSTQAADVYSLSVLALETLVGAKAIYGGTLEELLVRKNRMDLSVQLSQIRTNFTAGLSEALAIGLSASPNDRKVTIAKIGRALRQASAQNDNHTAPLCM